MRVTGVYEAHISVSNLDRSVKFYEDVAGLTLAKKIEERGVAFMAAGGLDSGMIGLWSHGSSPLMIKSHFALACRLEDVLAAPARLKSHGIQAKSLFGEKIDEAIVIPWMPAVSVYFDDPDGHSVEFIHPLKGQGRSDLEIVSWSQWNALTP